jgi:hypothetical protein
MAPGGLCSVRSLQQTVMATFLLFVILQFCDAVTTLVFLHRGVAEANPLIRLALRLSATPVLPLLAFKAAGCALAWFAWRASRVRLLRRVNCFFAACVVWNLLVVAAA